MKVTLSLHTSRMQALAGDMVVFEQGTYDNGNPIITASAHHRSVYQLDFACLTRWRLSPTVKMAYSGCTSVVSGTRLGPHFRFLAKVVCTAAVNGKPTTKRRIGLRTALSQRYDAEMISLLEACLPHRLAMRFNRALSDLADQLSQLLSFSPFHQSSNVLLPNVEFYPHLLHLRPLPAV